MSGQDLELDQVRSLVELDLRGLREEWRRRYGPPPSLRSVEYLRRLLAWRLQADAAGRADPAIKATLASPKRRRLSELSAPVGTILTREWRGERHEVEILEQGVRYRGQDYASLSEAARLIAGSRWNGPRFFGLRSPGA
jgi:hypothetical protein